MLGLGKVLEPVRAEIDKHGTGGQGAMRDISRDARHQYLAAVADGHEPRDAVNGRPKVITVSLDRFARMQRTAHPQASNCREVFGAERALRVHTSSNPFGCACKDAAKGVADGLEDMTAVPFYRGAQMCVVAF